MMKEKIVLIGAGSAMFIRGMIADILKRGMDCEVRLVDVDPEALEVAERLAIKMAVTSKSDIMIKASTDRRKMLKGATAVICTIGVGGRRAWEKDVFIPRKYGIYQPVGDTAMAGGASRALRMIPAMVAIAEDVLEFSPGALFFNYANPMSAVCRGVRKATGAEMTGLCHGVFHVARYLSKELGCGTESLSYSAAGINHLTWFTSLRCKGEDMTGKLKTLAARKIEKFRQQRELITSFEENGSHCRGNGMEVVQDPFSWMLTEMYGAFPAVMDRHVTEFFPGLFSSEKSYFGKTLGVDAYGFESVIAHGDSIYAEMEEVAFSKSPMPRKYLCGSEGEHEQVVEIISNIRLNREKIYSVNLPNRGRIPNLPYDAIVEAPAVTSGNGLRPLVPPPLPDCLAAILASKFLWIETVAEAALEGSMEKFVQALYLDSNSIDPYRTRAMAIELVEAQKKHLPQFETPSKGSGRICRIA